DEQFSAAPEDKRTAGQPSKPQQDSAGGRGDANRDATKGKDGEAMKKVKESEGEGKDRDYYSYRNTDPKSNAQPTVSLLTIQEGAKASEKFKFETGKPIAEANIYFKPGEAKGPPPEKKDDKKVEEEEERIPPKSPPSKAEPVPEPAPKAKAE